MKHNVYREKLFATEIHRITRKNVKCEKLKFIVSPLPGPLPEGEGVKTLDSRFRGNDKN